MPIGFNKPYFTGKETEYIRLAVKYEKISGDGIFTHKCHEFFQKRYGFRKVLLTTSCTDALEMAAILLDIRQDDEVIAPAYTFVSTVNAFVLRGAKIVFADSEEKTPNIDADQIESLVTPRTKAIVLVHYAGVACDMDKIMSIARKYNLFVVEDCAHAVDSFYKNKPLGSIGHLSAFSFHETKNVISGEGGMLAINDERFIKRAEIIWEKGTNRSAFFRGEIDKYGWVDIGSSFLPSEIIAAFLFAQLEKLDEIQKKRKFIWNTYYENLRTIEEKGLVRLPYMPGYATNNAHMFYLVCKSLDERTALINYLGKHEVSAVSHYLSLHKSPYYSAKYKGGELHNADHYTDRLIRLPFYYELNEHQVVFIANLLKNFYKIS